MEEKQNSEKPSDRLFAFDLSERETDVAWLLLDGKSRGEIADNRPRAGQNGGRKVAVRVHKRQHRGQPQSFFEKWYRNKVRVIHFDQQGAWGQPVEIAAKIDLTGMDTKNLCFYYYDKVANSYKRIGNPEYWIDKNVYLHFTTEYAGDIVVSDGPLTRK